MLAWLSGLISKLALYFGTLFLAKSSGKKQGKFEATEKILEAVIEEKTKNEKIAVQPDVDDPFTRMQP